MTHPMSRREQAERVAKEHLQYRNFCVGEDAWRDAVPAIEAALDAAVAETWEKAQKFIDDEASGMSGEEACGIISDICKAIEAEVAAIRAKGAT